MTDREMPSAAFLAPGTRGITVPRGQLPAVIGKPMRHPRVSFFGDEKCPVCEYWLSEYPIVTVLIGIKPLQPDKARYQGAAVLVHAQCAGIDGVEPGVTEVASRSSAPTAAEGR